MSKKSAFLAAAVLAALIGHSCKMPIEIKAVNIKYDIPLRTANFNLATILMESLKDSFGDAEVEIYDMPGWTQSQAFLVSYVMKDLVPDFDPQTYLDDIKEQLKKMDPDESKPDIDIIYPDPIVIPKLTPDGIDDELYWFPMQALFQTMEDEINLHSTPHTPIPGIPLPIGGPHTVPLSGYGFSGMPNFMAINDLGGYNFASVIVETGMIELTFSLSSMDSGISITLPEIALVRNGLPDTDPDYIIVDELNGEPQVTLTSALPTKTLYFDLSGKRIIKDNPPQFVFIGAEEISGTFAGPAFVTSFDLDIHPQIHGIQLRGAEELKLGAMSPSLPDEIADTVKIENLPDELLNAEIAHGTLRLEATLPEFKGIGVPTTYCYGIDLGYEIHIKQEPSLLNGVPFPGLSEFDGTIWNPWVLSTANLTADNLAGKSISGKDVNIITENNAGGSLEFSRLILSTDPDTGCNFELFDNDEYHFHPGNTGGTNAFTDRSLPLILNMAMEINELEVVRWKLEDTGGESIIPSPNIPEIDFGNLGETSPGAGDGKNVAAFVEYIVFEEIKLGIDFTYPDPLPSPMHAGDTSVSGDPGLPGALQDRLALKVSCPDLGLDQTQFLTAGLVEYVSKNPDNPSSTEVKYELNDSFDNPKVLRVDVEFIPVINGAADPDAEYIELGPFTLGSSDIQLNICATADIGFKWKEALIHPKKALEDKDPASLDALKGTYPENPDDFIDLSMIRQYLNGITYRTDNLAANLYLAGPPKLINLLDLSLEFGAEYKEKLNDGDDDDPLNWSADITWPDIVGGALRVYDPDNFGETLPQLPGPVLDNKGNKQWVYTGTALPAANPAGLSVDAGFIEEIVKGPKDMRFSYEMVLPDDLIVTPDMFPDTESNSSIDVQFIMRLPLEFRAAAGAEFALPDDVIDKDKDLFGRDTKNDPIFGDIGKKIDITKLVLKIDFSGQPFFAGTRLHIGGYPDGVTKLFGPNGINIVSGNSLAITFSKKDWDTINGDLILPDIRLVYPQARNFSIPRNFKPTNISIEATGNYTDTIDLDSLLGN